MTKPLQVDNKQHQWHQEGEACDTLQDSTDDSSIDKFETSLEQQEHFSYFQDMTDALPCHVHLPACI